MKADPIVVIDLFSGAGGLSLGAARAGLEVVAAVETDPHAAACHALNFPRVKHVDVSVADLTGRDIRKLADNKPFALIGGPPCQGFSRIGRRDPKDERNSLFSHFFRLVRESAPEFYVAENVPGILDHDFAPLRELALEQVSTYHNLSPQRLIASDFGAPTKRERVFFIGFRAQPKHLDVVSLAKRGARDVVVQDALAGLPEKVDPNWQSEVQSWRKVGHYTDLDFHRAAWGQIPAGVGSELGIRRLKQHSLVSGCFGTRHSEDVVRRFNRTEAGTTEPISRAYRLDPAGVCPTLRAGTDRTRGSFQALRPIHPRQDRMITPREAARLQGFPDWFVFSPTKWHSFRQIGNSVSPLLSKRLLGAIRELV